MMKDEGIERLWKNIEDLDKKKVIMKVRKMLENMEKLREGVEEGVERYRINMERKEEVMRKRMMEGMKMEEIK